MGTLNQDCISLTPYLKSVISNMKLKALPLADDSLSNQAVAHLASNLRIRIQSVKANNTFQKGDINR
jgi:hypothetical protein